MHSGFRRFLLAYILYRQDVQQDIVHVNTRASEAAVLFSVLLHCQSGPVIFMAEEVSAQPEVKQLLANLGWSEKDMSAAVLAQLKLKLEESGMILPSGDAFMVGPAFYKFFLAFLKPVAFTFPPDELIKAVDKELKRRAEITH